MYQIATMILQPYPSLFVLAAISIACVWWKRRETRVRCAFVTISLTLLFLISFPPVAFLALASLEWKSKPLDLRPADVDGIVVLSSYVQPKDEFHPRAVLDEKTLRRCLHGFDLYRQGRPIPIVVTGGEAEPGSDSPPMAAAMRDFLVEIGVRDSDIIVEGKARSTYQNAAECRKLLKERHLRKVLLVTHATHMPRALGCFRKLGIDALSSACDYRANWLTNSLETYLPDPRAALACSEVFHEWLGIAWYCWKGRI